MFGHLGESSSLGSHGLQLVRLLYPWRFSRQEYWSGLSCPPPGDLPDPGIELGFPALQADSLPAELPGKPLLDTTLIQIIIPFKVVLRIKDNVCIESVI